MKKIVSDKQSFMQVKVEKCLRVPQVMIYLHGNV